MDMTSPYDLEIDCRDMLCPLPVLRTRKHLMALQPGAVLRVLATDRASILDMPHFCNQTGHTYLGCLEEGALIVHWIRRHSGVE